MLAKRTAPLCCGLICQAVASVDDWTIDSVSALLVAGLAPPLATVMAAVPTPAMSAALTWAWTCVVETKVVVRGLPFHCTVDAALKPVPITVCK